MPGKAKSGLPSPPSSPAAKAHPSNMSDSPTLGTPEVAVVVPDAEIVDGGDHVEPSPWCGDGRAKDAA
jgi:hypothetical protein